MKRLITVFALAAALFVLMGCGTGSKESVVEQPSPTQDTGVEQPKTYSLLLGSYLGNEGLVIRMDSELEGELADKRARLLQTEEDIKYLRGEVSAESLTPEDKSAYEEIVAGFEVQRDELTARISRLEGELTVLRITSIGFSLSKNEETGAFVMSDFSIETDKDETVYKKNDAGEMEMDENDQPIVDHMNRFFGDSVSVNGVLFDEKTGIVSFCFEHNALHYRFEGQVAEEQIEGRTGHVLSGMISVSDVDGNNIQKGSWRVIYVPQQPADESAEGASEETPAQPADESSQESGSEEEPAAPQPEEDKSSEEDAPSEQEDASQKAEK